MGDRLFGEIEEIEEALVEHCVQPYEESKPIRNLTNYDWWDPRRHDVLRTLYPDSISLDLPTPLTVPEPNLEPEGAVRIVVGELTLKNEVAR
jgi:hypothetical protein